MTDPIKSLLREAAQNIVVPSGDARAVVRAGKRRWVRVAIISTAGVAVAMTLTFAALSTLDTGDVPVAPTEATRAADMTLFSVSSDDPSLTFPLASVEASLRPLAHICFTFPLDVHEARITSVDGETVAEFSEFGATRSERIQTSCVDEEVAVIEALATSPETHRLIATLDNKQVEGRLTVISSIDLDAARSTLSAREIEATEAINRGDFDVAEEIGHDLIDNADASLSPENDVHHGHLILGHVALRQGDAKEAGRELLLAGNSPGSPQLSSFGPNMSLARDLLIAGETRVVLIYLDLVERFWNDRNGRLDYWKRLIRSGHQPDFGANLIYGEVAPARLDQSFTRETN